MRIEFFEDGGDGYVLYTEHIDNLATWSSAFYWLGLAAGFLIGGLVFS